jgi:hypothetical protein
MRISSLFTAKAALVVGAALVSSCGYRSVYGNASERYAVVLASTRVPDAVDADEVLAGIRDVLARANALSAGDAYPRCEVEVLRADETSEGIDAVRASDAHLVPSARAVRGVVVGRAWVARSKDGPHERDTGDVRATDVSAAAEGARTATFRQSDGLRATSRRLGQSMGARLLGLPSASE